MGCNEVRARRYIYIYIYIYSTRKGRKSKIPHLIFVIIRIVTVVNLLQSVFDKRFGAIFHPVDSAIDDGVVLPDTLTVLFWGG